MKAVYIFCVLLTVMFSTSCATMFIDSYQNVEFINTPQNAILKTNRGQKVEFDGKDTFRNFRRKMMPIKGKVICQNKKQASLMIQSYPNFTFMFWNFFNFPIGYAVDAVTQNGFSYTSPIDLDGICGRRST